MAEHEDNKSYTLLYIFAAVEFVLILFVYLIEQKRVNNKDSVVLGNTDANESYNINKIDP